MAKRHLTSLLLIMVVFAIRPGETAAQSATAQPAGIVATGVGKATQQPKQATIQFLLGSADFFGMSGMMSGSIDAGPGTPMAMDPGMFGPTTDVSPEMLQPVVEDLVAAGIPDTSIVVTAPTASIFMGMGTPAIGELMLTLEPVDTALLANLADIVQVSAGAIGLAIIHHGALYEAEDCAELLQSAREIAVAEARQRAEGLALALGVTLGNLVQAVEATMYFETAGGTCTPAGQDLLFGPFGPGSLPAFDPQMILASDKVQVTLTYEFS